MANSVKLKRSSVAGKIPTTADLDLGELAINTHDGKIFIKKDDGSGTTAIITAGQESMPLDGGSMQGDLDMNSHKVVGLADPTSDGDATPKSYVDSLVAGLRWKNPVKSASTSNLDLNGTETLDGISCGVGDRVLVMSQTNAADNGIYVVASGAWTRATDFDSLTPIDEINGAAVYVEQGSTYGDVSFTVVSQVNTLGSDNIDFAQFNGTSDTQAGNGLNKVGNTLSVDPDGSTLTVAAAGVKISDTVMNTINDKLSVSTGGTLSGDISISKANPWLTLDSLTSGGTGTDQGAGISIGEAGKKGASALHLTYTGDGHGHIGMGTVDATSGLPQYEAMTLNYTDNTVSFLGAVSMSSNLYVTNYVQGKVLYSTVATGTAPLHVDSTTVVSNLNADLLDGHHSSYFLTTTGKAADSSKLEGHGLFTANVGSVSIPTIGASNGVMEIGRYIDFHTSSSTTDYDIRLNCSGADTLQVDGGGITIDSGTLAINSGPLNVNSGKVLIAKNIGTSSTYSNGQLELRCTDDGDVSMGFHRSGATACQLRHEGNGLILSGTSETSAANFKVTGGITHGSHQTPLTNNNLNLGSSSLKYANVYATTFQGRATSANYADLAEKYSFEDDVVFDEGRVVLISDNNNVDCKSSDDIASDSVLGVMSLNPAFMMNNELEDGYYVALKGRVPCYVQGPVRKGEPLVSYFNGTAIGVNNNLLQSVDLIKPSIIFGKTLENIDDDGLHLIEIVVL